VTARELVPPIVAIVIAGVAGVINAKPETSIVSPSTDGDFASRET
jgi:hypothetical protein